MSRLSGGTFKSLPVNKYNHISLALLVLLSREISCQTSKRRRRVELNIEVEGTSFTKSLKLRPYDRKMQDLPVKKLYGCGALNTWHSIDDVLLSTLLPSLPKKIFNISQVVHWVEKAVIILGSVQVWMCPYGCTVCELDWRAAELLFI